MNIAAIILAGGYSQRMGQQKVLLPFGNVTIIEHLIAILRESTLDSIMVVAGHHPEKLRKKLSQLSISLVVNDHYETGMLSSIRCGLKALPQNIDVTLVVLGDQLLFYSEMINLMITAYIQRQGKIIIPVYKGKRGHPLLFSMQYYDEILTSFDNVGLRGLIWKHKEDIFDMESDNPAVMIDMDYPDDYQQALFLAQKHGIID